MFEWDFLSEFLSSLLIAVIIAALGIGGYKIYINKKYTKKIKNETSQKNPRQESRDGGSNIIQSIQGQDITLIVNIYQDPHSQKPIIISSTKSTATAAVLKVSSIEEKSDEQ